MRRVTNTNPLIIQGNVPLRHLIVNAKLPLICVETQWSKWLGQYSKDHWTLPMKAPAIDPSAL